jgi:hypothetical protein
MAATSSKAQPIQAFRELIGGTAQVVLKRLLEKATQTFLVGTPVQVEAASGFIIACATINSAATALIAGFAAEPGANLTTSGTPKTLTYGSVQNQASAVLIPVGAPPNDGTNGFMLAIDSTTFVGIKGGSTNGSPAIAQTDLQKIYGLTKDAGNNYWYIDSDITTVAGGACVQITDLIDPVGTVNGRLGFKVLHAAQQLSGN